jgi:hypothetical protein
MPAWCKRLAHPNPAHIRISQHLMIADQAYITRSKATISIEATVVGLNADRLVGGPVVV